MALPPNERSESAPEGRFETQAIHCGQQFREETGAVIPPMFLTSTFEKGNPGGFDYTRSCHPNNQNLESILAALEGAQHATVFGSGVSAITGVVSFLVGIGFFHADVPLEEGQRTSHKLAIANKGSSD